jgi:alanyl-tRNA synthetase
MDSVNLRKSFLDFFKSKKHHIVPSAPLVLKNDPTLMFVNAGMNQFKDIFLGYSGKTYSRVADTQKCLRVSGKHNDLDEVGHDTYHHTLFEMLGNWSFGDYYKKEAIAWAWEYLTDVLKIDKDRLYATVFEGDKADGLNKDEEAYGYWKEFLPEERILNGNKKDNFWEMGTQGPCGPCSEIHVDIRSDEERAKIPGKELINKDHPQVIEIWNLVFIQYNRKADGSLENLPEKHIDTGMGFERLAMVTQGKQSNYDTDIFQGIIRKLSELCNIKYGTDEKTDIALRVVADHLRAVSFSIADGQLPSNNGAGYVIRRILRRAVRYGYTFLNMKEPFIFKLLPALQENMGEAFPELIKNSELISKVLKEEEAGFFRTLETGMSLIEKLIQKSDNKQIKGQDAFVLYDTYGFPYDLTELIARENGFTVDKDGFEKALNEQKQRSKKDAETETDDWIEVNPQETPEFIGYDYLETKSKIIKYRKIKKKGKEIYQIVLNKNPFYAESGGQVGDKGYIEDTNGNKIPVIDTIKENNLSVSIITKLPGKLNDIFKAIVNTEARQNSANNHTATHLLHHALRKVLGTHVEQKGSLVTPDYLRFDFSHYQKLSKEELTKVEAEVNKMIRANYPLVEKRETTMQQAQEMGAMALFGEKYGDKVRVIKFGDSVELCGGTHVKATGDIACLKITQETSVASGIRRIEAITAQKAEEYINNKINTLQNIASLFKGTKDLPKTIEKLIDDNQKLQKKIDEFAKEKAKQIKAKLKTTAKQQNGINIITQKINIDSADILKDLSFQLKGEIENLILILGAEINNKPIISIMLSDELVKQKDLDAGKIIRESAKEIKGGGGGQKFYATAGGKDVNGIEKAISKAEQLIIEKL